MRDDSEDGADRMVGRTNSRMDKDEAKRFVIISSNLAWKETQ